MLQFDILQHNITEFKFISAYIYVLFFHTFFFLRRVPVDPTPLVSVSCCFILFFVMPQVTNNVKHGSE